MKFPDFSDNKLLGDVLTNWLGSRDLENTSSSEEAQQEIAPENPYLKGAVQKFQQGSFRVSGLLVRTILPREIQALPQELEDPTAWVEAAKNLAAQGHFLEALEILQQAEHLNEGTEPGVVSLVSLSAHEPDLGVRRNIQTLRQDIRKAQGALAQQVKAEITLYRTQLSHLEGEALSEALQNLARLENALAWAEGIDDLGIQQQGLAPYLKRAQVQLLSGALQGNELTLEAGYQLATLLTRYARAEATASEFSAAFVQKYPAYSAINHQLDYSAHNPVVRPYIPEPGYLTGAKVLPEYQPSLQTLQNLPVVLAYGQLQASENPEEQAVAAHLDSVLSFLQFPHRAGEDTGDLASLEAHVQQMEALFSHPALGSFFAKVAEKENAELNQNAGYQNRLALQANLTSLQAYHELDQVLSLKELDAASLGFAQDFLRSRAVAYRETLLTELEKARSEDRQAAREATAQESYWGGSVREVRLVGPKEAAATKRLAEFEEIEGRLTQWQATETRACESLQTIAQDLAHYEEAQVRHGITAELHHVTSLSFSPGDEQLLALYGQLNVEGKSLQDRLGIYQSIVTQADHLALVHSARGRAEMYRAMAENIRTTDRVFNGLTWLAGLGDTSGLFQSAGEAQVLAMADRYDAIATQASSGDFQGAQQAFIGLEQAQIGTRLQGMNQFSTQLNHYAVGVGIIIAAAATGGVAAGYLGFASGTGGFFAVSGTTFTLTHRALWAGVRGDLKPLYDTRASFIDNALSFTGEAALNVGMFASIGKSLELFNCYFNSASARIAAGRLRAKGITVPSPAQLAAETKSLQATWQSHGLRYGGGFTTELAAFGAYDFISSNAQMLVQGQFDPLGTAQHVFSKEAWIDRFFFLVALKVGGALASPVTRLTNQAAERMVLTKWQPRLERAEAKIAEAHENFAKYLQKGEGELATVVSQYREALQFRLDILEKIPVAHRNTQSIETTQETLKALDRFSTEHEIVRDMFGENNPYDVLFVKGQGLVPPENFARFVHDLRVNGQRPYSPLENIREYSNGLVEVDYREATTGQVQTLRFLRQGFVSSQAQPSKEPASLWFDRLGARLFPGLAESGLGTFWEPAVLAEGPKDIFTRASTLLSQALGDRASGAKTPEQANSDLTSALNQYTAAKNRYDGNKSEAHLTELREAYRGLQEAKETLQDLLDDDTPAHGVYQNRINALERTLELTYKKLEAALAQPKAVSPDKVPGFLLKDPLTQLENANARLQKALKEYHTQPDSEALLREVSEAAAELERHIQIAHATSEVADAFAGKPIERKLNVPVWHPDASAAYETRLEKYVKELKAAEALFQAAQNRLTDHVLQAALRPAEDALREYTEQSNSETFQRLEAAQRQLREVLRQFSGLDVEHKPRLKGTVDAVKAQLTAMMASLAAPFGPTTVPEAAQALTQSLRNFTDAVSRYEGERSEIHWIQLTEAYGRLTEARQALEFLVGERPAEALAEKLTLADRQIQRHETQFRNQAPTHGKTASPQESLEKLEDAKRRLQAAQAQYQSNRRNGTGHSPELLMEIRDAVNLIHDEIRAGRTHQNENQNSELTDALHKAEEALARFHSEVSARLIQDAIRSSTEALKNHQETPTADTRQRLQTLQQELQARVDQLTESATAAFLGKDAVSRSLAKARELLEVMERSLAEAPIPNPVREEINGATASQNTPEALPNPIATSLRELEEATNRLDNLLKDHEAKKAKAKISFQALREIILAGRDLADKFFRVEDLLDKQPSFDRSPHESLLSKAADLVDSYHTILSQGAPLPEIPRRNSSEPLEDWLARLEEAQKHISDILKLSPNRPGATERDQDLNRLRSLANEVLRLELQCQEARRTLDKNPNDAAAQEAFNNISERYLEAQILWEEATPS